MFFTFEDIIDKKQIKAKAKSIWNSLSPVERIRDGIKYKHICNGLNAYNWLSDFDDLNETQQNLLIKGEFIRTYDNMLLSDKKKLTNESHLSKFETKWYKMSPVDKKKILKFIL